MVTISTARVSCAATARGPPPNPFAVLTAPPASKSGISCSSRYPVYEPARDPTHLPSIRAPAAITPRQGRPVILACRVSGPATPAFIANGCPVGAENFIHVTRPGGIRRSCHRREPFFGRGSDQDRPVRVAVSLVSLVLRICHTVDAATL